MAFPVTSRGEFAPFPVYFFLQIGTFFPTSVAGEAVQTITYGDFHDGEVDLVQLGIRRAELVTRAAGPHLVDLMPFRELCLKNSPWCIAFEVFGPLSSEVPSCLVPGGQVQTIFQRVQSCGE